jgi:hypothetical protein
MPRCTLRTLLFDQTISPHYGFLPFSYFRFMLVVVLLAVLPDAKFLIRPIGSEKPFLALSTPAYPWASTEVWD